MTDAQLGRARLLAQGLLTRPYKSAVEAVTASLAMQGQDLPGVLASAALRLADGPDPAAVLADLNSGKLVRGYPMRGTVFLMPAADLAWLSQLCNAAMLRAAEKRRAQLGLDQAMVDSAAEIGGELLAGEPLGLSRAELFDHWAKAQIPTDAGRGYHVLAHLIGCGVFCFGPWNGSEQNVVLSASWLPEGSDLESRFNGDRVAAIAEALRRYLTSHGPATIRDFAWWTKLPLAEIRAALPLVAAEFEATADPEPSYRRPGLVEELEALGKLATQPMLLPGFDEFILGYQDRLFAMTEEEHKLLVPGNNGVFGKSIVIDGIAKGIWKRGGRPGKRSLELAPFKTISQANVTKLNQHFQRFPFVTD